jgi:UPF0755 protein
MPAKNRRKPKHLFGFIIFLILCAGLLLAILVFAKEVSEEFGEPSPNLSLTQRIIYPIELIFNRKELITPLELPGKNIDFEVGDGESVSLVCLRLENLGLIQDAELFRIYLVYTGLDRYLQAGDFELNSSFSPVKIANQLLDATPKDAVVTILPGWRIEEIAKNISLSGLSITEDAFISVAYDTEPQYSSLVPVENINTFEGFFFPGTYVIPRESDLNFVMTLILSEFTKNLDDTLIAGFTRQGLNLYDAVILASIIEKEAVVNDEKPLIASVFLNRLAQGMRLETDPTVQYSLGFNEETGSWWKSPLSLSDLKIESPYNTYINDGLPPTPICNPDLGSLRSVAFPADTPYLYFRAACDGSGRHNFSITFEEHLENACD